MDQLEKELDSFLGHSKVKEQLEFIINDSNNEISAIQLIRGFKEHLIEMSAGDSNYGDIGIQFGVWILSSGYPIKTDKGTMRKSI